jgi:hypothetical protein
MISLGSRSGSPHEEAHISLCCSPCIRVADLNVGSKDRLTDLDSFIRAGGSGNVDSVGHVPVGTIEALIDVQSTRLIGDDRATDRSLRGCL